MTRSNRHRIERQVVELTLDGSHEPAAMQMLVSSMWARATPEIEAVFDGVASPDETLRLERLEVDLGTIAGSDWEPQFRRKLVTELARLLAELSDAASGAESRGELKPTNPFRQFLFFLAHGRLPWWGQKPQGSWTDWLSGISKPIDWRALHDCVRTDSRARIRFVDSVSDEFLDEAVTRWAGIPHSAHVLSLLARKAWRADNVRKWRREFWNVVVDRAMDGTIAAERAESLMRHLLEVRRGISMDTHQPSMPGVSDSRINNEPMAATATDERPDLPPPWREWLPHQYELSVRSPLSPVSRGATASVGVASLAARDGARTGKVDRSEAQSDSIYFDGAGAILLHPFLEQLFRERGLLVGRDFRDSAARQRAVHLIGVLTFGVTTVPEYDLLTAKLLCGYAFNEPLEPFEIDDSDLVACEDLLRAVLTHWTALRSSSEQWLREQFFRRDGKLEKVDSGWRLTVERRAQDVLLARLPWGFGVIGLPWMKEKIFVRWLD